MSRWNLVLCKCFLLHRMSVFIIFLGCCLVLPFHALPTRGVLKQDVFIRGLALLFWVVGVGGREGVAGAYRPLKEQDEMVPIHGILLVKYTFPSVSLVFYFGSASYLSCELLLALDAQGYFGWLKVECFCYLPFGLWAAVKPRSSCALVLLLKSYFLLQALLNPGWPCTNQALVVLW